MNQLLSEHAFRLDGRRSHQIRNINCQLGVSSHADGSAIIDQGNTRVLAVVHGPHEPTTRRGQTMTADERCYINCEFSMATFSTTQRKTRPRGDRKSIELSRHLKKTFDSVIDTSLYPRSQIDIFCEVLQADGGSLAACINAASLALVDAGIAMRGIVSSCACGSTNGVVCVDLSNNEESSTASDVPRLTVATVGGGDEVVLLELDRRVHHDHLEMLIDEAINAAKHVHSCMQTAVRAHLANVVRSMHIDAV